METKAILNNYVGSYKLAFYDVYKNVILYRNESAISHELLYVATNSISALIIDDNNFEMVLKL